MSYTIPAKSQTTQVSTQALHTSIRTLRCLPDQRSDGRGHGNDLLSSPATSSAPIDTPALPTHVLHSPGSFNVQHREHPALNSPYSYISTQSVWTTNTSQAPTSKCACSEVVMCIWWCNKAFQCDGSTESFSIWEAGTPENNLEAGADQARCQNSASSHTTPLKWIGNRWKACAAVRSYLGPLVFPIFRLQTHAKATQTKPISRIWLTALNIAFPKPFIVEFKSQTMDLHFDLSISVPEPFLTAHFLHKRRPIPTTWLACWAVSGSNSKGSCS